jgi:hypothetical protein
MGWRVGDGSGKGREGREGCVADYKPVAASDEWRFTSLLSATLITVSAEAKSLA